MNEAGVEVVAGVGAQVEVGLEVEVIVVEGVLLTVTTRGLAVKTVIAAGVEAGPCRTQGQDMFPEVHHGRGQLRDLRIVLVVAVYHLTGWKPMKSRTNNDI